MNRHGKQLRLERLKNTHCTRCKLYKSSKHVCILGKGNVMGSIMLIGEAPGSAEAESGQVFCGRAGKLLDKLLKLLEMYHLVYITNACRCRPPKNRNLTSAELEACNYYFRREIDIIKPKVIILLGRTAVTAMGFGADVNAGSEYFYCSPWPACYIKATWHPSYCLRRGKGATHDLYLALKWARDFINEKSI